MNQHPTELLRNADELPLDAVGSPNVCRIFLLGTSTALMSYMFRLTPTSIAAKTCPSHSSDIGPWAPAHCDFPVGDAWGRLTSALNICDYWGTAQPADDGSFDGAHYLIEGFRDGDYRCLSFRNPVSELTDFVADLCNQCVLPG